MTNTFEVQLGTPDVSSPTECVTYADYQSLEQQIAELKEFTLDANTRAAKEIGLLQDQVKDLSWISVEDFEKSEHTGYCAIIYKGKMHQAYYDGIFRFNPITNECYMTECISKVMPIPALKDTGTHEDN